MCGTCSRSYSCTAAERLNNRRLLAQGRRPKHTFGPTLQVSSGGMFSSRKCLFSSAISTQLAEADSTFLDWAIHQCRSSSKERSQRIKRKTCTSEQSKQWVCKCYKYVYTHVFIHMCVYCIYTYMRMYMYLRVCQLPDKTGSKGSANDATEKSCYSGIYLRTHTPVQEMTMKALLLCTLTQTLNHQHCKL